MTNPNRPELGRASATFLAAVLVLLLAVPMVALVFSASPQELVAGLVHPLFVPALWLSLQTSAISLLVVVCTGTPLAWWLANRHASRIGRVVQVLVDLPIVIPPAVVGVALLQAYGRRGMMGPWLESLGVSIPFSTTAVVLAQIVVSAPFFVQAATSAFRTVDLDLLVVARTLGASRTEAVVRIAVPVALPGLVGGSALAWARGLGEFGATLLFAGNLTGTSQTLPLAIYTALESDVRVAVAISLVLGALGGALLLVLRGSPPMMARKRATP